MKHQTLRRIGIAILAASAALFAPIDTWADTLYVDAAKGVDAPDYGYAIDTPVKTIQRALDMANAEGDVVIVAPGTYAPFNAWGLEGITIKSSGGATKTVVDGENKERCATFKNSETMTIEGFTLKNGHATENSPGRNYKPYGGGVCYATVKDCIILGCSADSDGGGVYGGEIHNTLISDCIANGSGGGIDSGEIAIDCIIRSNTAKVDGGGVSHTPLTKCVVSNNVSNTRGGGIIISGQTVDDCTICCNTALAGGGVFAEKGTFKNCYIYGNHATATSNGGWNFDLGGGGVCGFNGYGNSIVGASFYDCKIYDNTAARFGGGATGVNLYNCYVYRNSAPTGAGGYLLWAHSSLITDNMATGDGGGVYGGVLRNCTVTGNTAGGTAGGVFSTDNDQARRWDHYTVICYNTIVYGNYATNDVDSADGYLGKWYNSCVGYLRDDLDTIKQGVIFKNPKFVDAAKGDYRLSADSPCIDKGDNENVETDSDYAGMERICNGTVDMGAYEYGAGVKKHTVSFSADAYYATLDETSRDIEHGKAVGTLPDVTVTADDYYSSGVWHRYTLKGWFTKSSGGDLVTASTIITSDVTFYAQFELVEIPSISYIVTFNANGGSVSSVSRTVADGETVGELPTPARSGWTFGGWWTAASGGTQVTEATIVSADVTYYAHWTQGGGGGEGTPDPVKPDPVNPGYEVIEEKDIVAPYDVPKAVTVMGAVYDGNGAVAGVLELKLGKVNANKGTGKVSGSFVDLDGKKHTIKGPKLEGIDGTAPLAATFDVKDFGAMNVTIGGGQFAGSLGNWHVQSANVGGDWKGRGATVTVDANNLSMFAGTVLEDLLPNEEQATVSGGKWSFSKAASVKWAKPKKGAALPEIYDEASGKGLIVDTSKGTNLSGLKLTYTPKKGTFKGPFKVYALEGASPKIKLKKYTVKVNGVVVGGVGYGKATSKKPVLSWSVTVR